MHMRISIALILIVALTRSPAMGQNQERYIGFPHRVEIAWSWSPAPDPQADPAYASYREGYGLILDEKWEEARRRFRELISKHPDSRYVEDAQYWSAYALPYTSLLAYGWPCKSRLAYSCLSPERKPWSSNHPTEASGYCSYPAQ